MAVVKRTSSGNGVQFIDDEGNVFMTSALYVRQLLDGNNRSGLILLNRLPLKVSEDRFKKSPLWDPKGYASKDGLVGEQTNADSISNKGRKLVKQAEAIDAMEDYKL